MSGFLGIDIKTLDDDVFQFYQTGLLQKVLDGPYVENCNEFPEPTQV